MNDNLAAALAYYERGFSIIPMKMADKKPALRWKRYQAERAEPTRIRRWFKDGTQRSVGIIFGAVSGGLASRDFDDMAAYDQWASEHPELAKTLPTVETRRGRHVYFLVNPAQLQSLRDALGKPDGTGAIDCGDGELRAGAGCYSVLPPSVHPEGHVYRWLIHLAGLRQIDLHASGLAPLDRDYRRQQMITERTDDIGGEVVGGIEISSSVPLPQRPFSYQAPQQLPATLLTDEVMQAIERTLPTGLKKRHTGVFALARALKGMPEFAEVDARTLRPIVKLWDDRARPYLTKPFHETWFDFTEGWPKVKFPNGKDTLKMIREKATLDGLPEVVSDYEECVQWLVAVCRELQRVNPDSPFFLSCRKAGELFGVNKDTANKWLRGLLNDGILFEVTKGDPSGKASRYRYLAPL